MGLHRNPEGLLSAQYSHPSNSSVYEERAAFGELVHEHEFRFEQLNDRPLVGVSYIKLCQGFHARLDGGKALEFLREEVWRILIAKVALLKDLSVAVGLSYGWEDLLLVTMGKRYDHIKALVYELRSSLHFEDAQKYFKPQTKTQQDEVRKRRHVVSTTHTVFAAFLDWPSDAAKPKATRVEAKSGEREGVVKVDPRVKAAVRKLRNAMSEKDTMLVDKVVLETRPGHADWVVKSINLKVPVGEHDFSVGRYDVSIRFTNLPIGEYVEFYFNSLRPRLELSNSPVVSMKTMFMLSAGGRTVESSARSQRPIRADRLSEREYGKINKIAQSAGLPAHGTSALANVLLAGWYLKHSYFAKGGVGSVTGFIAALQASLENDGAALRGGVATGEIIPLLQICFADRFRGMYPVGEGYSTSLITYKGAFHKHLLCVDHICAVVYGHFGHHLKSQLRLTVRPLHFCSFIGPGSSPAVLPFASDGYDLAIAQVPLDSLLIPNDLHYLFHEMGHVLADALGLSSSIEAGCLDVIYRREAEDIPGLMLQFGKMSGLVEEVLCDFLLLSVGFLGDTDAFVGYMRDYSGKLLGRVPGHTTDSVNIEIGFRIKAVLAMQAAFRDERMPPEELGKIRGLKKLTMRDDFSVALDLLCSELSGDSLLHQFLRATYAYPVSWRACPQAVEMHCVRTYLKGQELQAWVRLLYPNAAVAEKRP